MRYARHLHEMAGDIDAAARASTSPPRAGRRACPSAATSRRAPHGSLITIVGSAPQGAACGRWGSPSAPQCARRGAEQTDADADRGAAEAALLLPGRHAVVVGDPAEEIRGIGAGRREEPARHGRVTAPARGKNSAPMSVSRYPIDRNNRLAVGPLSSSSPHSRLAAPGATRNDILTRAGSRRPRPRPCRPDVCSCTCQLFAESRRRCAKNSDRGRASLRAVTSIRYSNRRCSYISAGQSSIVAIVSYSTAVDAGARVATSGSKRARARASSP